MAAALFSHYRNCGTCGSSSSQGGSHVPILIFKLNCCKFQIVNSIMPRSDCRCCLNLQTCQCLKAWLVQADGWCVMCVHVQPGHYSCIYHPAGGPGIQVAAAALCMGPALHHQPQAVPSCRPQRCQGIQRSAQGDTCTPLHTPWTPPAISWPCEVETPSHATSSEGQFTQAPLGQ